MSAHSEAVEQDMTKALSKFSVSHWALILTVAINLIALVTFFNKMDNRTTVNETAIRDVAAVVAGLKETVEQVKTDNNNVSSSTNTMIARIQERQAAQGDTIKEIKEIVKEIGKK